MIAGTKKLQLQHRLLSDDGPRFRLRFQSLFQNALQAVDVEQVEVESPPASRVQTSGAETFGQAEQLLRLTRRLQGNSPLRSLSVKSAAADPSSRARLQ